MQQIIQYIYDLSDEMGEHIDGITSSLCMFIDVGVPIICCHLLLGSDCYDWH